TSILMPPQTKDLICGEALEDVENAVYKLKNGELTSPLFVENSYYVFRLKSVAPHPEYSKRNYVYWIMMENIRCLFSFFVNSYTIT
ncbi:MAG TPA: hypothetical protein VHP30_14035, partial [Ignavibacteriales bacterium]|nr:hypothetical protein [Ignavibacteriales bacterium]